MYTPEQSRVRPGLQHLFGAPDTASGGQPVEPDEAAPSAGVAGGDAGDALDADTANSAAAATLGPSAFLAAYEAERREVVLPVGFQPLDDVLGGGVDRGAMVVSGDPGAGKTLLLEEAARSALARGWWVYYAAYREGTLRAWERLMARESLDDEGLPLPFSAIRGRTLDTHSLERLRALDARLRRHGDSRLVLVDRLPGGRDGLRSLVDNIWWRQREAREAGADGPLVLVDDLQTLERLVAEADGDRLPSGALGVGPAASLGGGSVASGGLVGRFDRELLRLGLPALISAAPAAAPGAGREGRPAYTDPGSFASFSVRLTAGAADGSSEVPLEVSVEKNGRTGWVGRLPATLDRRIGRFSS